MLVAHGRLLRQGRLLLTAAISMTIMLFASHTMSFVSRPAVVR